MSQIPRGPEHLTCPMRGKAMSKVCHTCPWWTQVRGTNPQGGDVDRWDCAIAFLPMLSIETAKHVRGVQQATESTRNELCRRMDTQKPTIKLDVSDYVREIETTGGTKLINGGRG